MTSLTFNPCKWQYSAHWELVSQVKWGQLFEMSVFHYWLHGCNLYNWKLSKCNQEMTFYQPSLHLFVWSRGISPGPLWPIYLLQARDELERYGQKHLTQKSPVTGKAICYVTSKIILKFRYKLLHTNGILPELNKWRRPLHFNVI